MFVRPASIILPVPNTLFLTAIYYVEMYELMLIKDAGKLNCDLQCLTRILLTWTIWRAPTNASKWRMGFNSAFKGLIKVLAYWRRSCCEIPEVRTTNVSSTCTPGAQNIPCRWRYRGHSWGGWASSEAAPGRRVEGAETCIFYMKKDFSALIKF